MKTLNFKSRFLVLLVGLLTLCVTQVWGVEQTATFTMKNTGQSSPVTVNGVTFTWTSSNIVTGTNNASGFKASSNMTVTIPAGKILTAIVKGNGNTWGGGAQIDVYAGTSSSGAKITTITSDVNSYAISSDNTGTTYYFANTSSKNAWLNSLTIKYDDAPAENTITITAGTVADFASSYATYNWTANGVSGKMYAYQGGSTGSYNLQFNKSTAIYNTVPVPGRITSVKMTKVSGTDRAWSVYVAASALTSTEGGTNLNSTPQTVGTGGYTWDVTSGNYSYFYITKADGGTNISEIVITYENAGPTTYTASVAGGLENGSFK